jgi:hypothetical protein
VSALLRLSSGSAAASAGTSRRNSSMSAYSAGLQITSISIQITLSATATGGHGWNPDSIQRLNASICAFPALQTLGATARYVPS